MSRRSRVAAVFLFLVFCLTPATALASGTVHWGYEGDAGPQYWGTLSPDFAACGEGKAQSPIDIPFGAALNPPDLVLAYQPSALNIVNNGHSIQVNYDTGSSLQVGGKSYPLAQFHLHSLSEHTLAGAHTPMELHLVHKDSAGRIAVIGVMLVEGAANSAYEPVLANMPAEEGEPQAVAGVTVDAAALLPVDRSYYRYDGSLTTPPCTEGVTWLVMAKPVELSAAQAAAFQALYRENYRPVQPMNGRGFLLTASVSPSTLPTSGAGVDRAIASGLALGLVLVTLGIVGRAPPWR